jgi:phage tail tape-measure protein
MLSVNIVAMAEVGACVGRALGCTVGPQLGDCVGATVGNTLGIALGMKVGSVVGLYLFGKDRYGDSFEHRHRDLWR